MFVAGVYGKYPVSFGPDISCQLQYDRFDAALSDAFMAFLLTALKDRAGGSIRPFCEPDTVRPRPIRRGGNPPRPATRSYRPPAAQDGLPRRSHCRRRGRA